MNISIIVKGVVIAVLLVFSLFGGYSVPHSISVWSKSSSLKKYLDNSLNTQDILQQDIKTNYVQFSKARGSSSFMDKEYIHNAMSNVEGCSLAGMSIGSVGQYGEIKSAPIATLADAKDPDILIYSLECANISTGLKVLDGYNFLYESYQIKYDKNMIVLSVRVKEV
jgi:hypothetical protein